MFTPAHLKGARVSNLIQRDGRWDEEVVKAKFTQRDVEDILNIPLGSPPPSDEIIWGQESKGCFTVKSAYHLAVSLDLEKMASCSNEHDSKMFWRKLWGLRIVPRAKICLWKVLNDIIPTKVNLVKKGIDTFPLCSFCRKKPDSATHIFWQCKVTKGIWSYFIPCSDKFLSVCRLDWTVVDYWNIMILYLSEDDLNATAIIIWKF